MVANVCDINSNVSLFEYQALNCFYHFIIQILLYLIYFDSTLSMQGSIMYVFCFVYQLIQQPQMTVTYSVGVIHLLCVNINVVE